MKDATSSGKTSRPRAFATACAVVACTWAAAVVGLYIAVRELGLDWLR